MATCRKTRITFLSMQLGRAALGVLLASACSAIPASSRAVTYQVGPNLEYKNLSDVVPKLQAGDRVTIQPGEYFDCAIIGTSNITIEGLGANGAAVLTDKTCGGKGILVLSGNNVTIRNLTLTRARVADFNGAGIRNESQNLTVERVRFINNQNGILTGGPADGGTMIVRDSYFERNGTCERSCAHGIYANRLALLRVEGSTFLQTRQAHHIKSRAARTEVINNTINDGPEGTASYHIDLSNGGNLLVRGNTMVKGRKAENRTCAIMIGAEGVNQPTRDIKIENNRFRNEGDYDTVFVENRTAEDAMLTGNKIEGRAKALRGDGVVNP
jgi:Right handed beta helix region